jgi:hypothetical protein
MDLGWIAISIVFGIAIVLAFTLQVIKMGIAHEEKRLAYKAGKGEAGRLEQIVAANEAEMAKMRQRIEVLERLATDDERRLSREISGLHAERTST